MDKKKKARLQKKGWKAGTTADFLGLSPEETEYIELKLRLGSTIRIQREKTQLTQAQLARRIRSSQSRVAKMEAGDPSVSLDLLIRTHLALGATRADIASAIRSRRH